METQRCLTKDELVVIEENASIEYNGIGPLPEFITASINKQIEYRNAIGENNKRDTALGWIDEMSPLEFQIRFINGSLPDFVREKRSMDEENKLVRMTNHPFGLLPENILRAGGINQAYIFRNQLRYTSIDSFKREYYNNIFE